MKVSGGIHIALAEVAPKIIDGYWHEWINGEWVNTGTQADGRGIYDTKTAYAYSTSDTISPTSDWTYDLSSLGVKPVGHFLWARIDIAYTDDKTNYIGGQGWVVRDGVSGAEGKGIYATKTAYAYSSSDTVSPSGPWYYNLSSLGVKPAGHFLWARIDIAYTDNPTNYIGGQGWVVRDGASGAGEQTIYYNANIYPANPVGDNPIGWYWYPIAPSEQYKMVFISKRQKPEGGNWGPWSSVQLYNEYRASVENNPTYLMMGYWVKPVANDPKKPFYRKTELGTPMVKHLDGTELGYSVYVLEVDVSDDMPPSPSNPQWRMIESLEVLYLQNAYIERLQAEIITAQKINTLDLSANNITARDLNGNKLATVNEFGDGAYIQYYPSGNKNMEFGGGEIIYYNNDIGNTVKWVLGAAGYSSTYQSLDRWVSRVLAPTDANGSNVQTNNAIIGIEYKYFSPGTPSQYLSHEGLTVPADKVSEGTAPSSILTSDYIPSGWYAKPGMAFMDQDNPGYYTRELYYFGTNGKQTSSKIITWN